MKALIVTADQLQRGDWLVGYVLDTAVGREPVLHRRVGRVADPSRLGLPAGRRFIICREDDENEVIEA